MCLCLRQGRFHGEKRIVVLALVLASLVKTRLNGEMRFVYLHEKRYMRSQGFSTLTLKFKCYGLFVCKLIQLKQ